MPDELAALPDQAPALAVPRAELVAFFHAVDNSVAACEEAERLLANHSDPFSAVLLRGMREGTAKHRQTRDVIASLLGRTA